MLGQESVDALDRVVPGAVHVVTRALVFDERRILAGTGERRIGCSRPRNVAALVPCSMEHEDGLGDTREVGSRRHRLPEGGLLLRASVLGDDPPAQTRVETLPPVEVVGGIRTRGRVGDRGVVHARLDDERLEGDPAAHGPAEQGQPITVNEGECRLAYRKAGVDDVLGVAKTHAQVGLRITVGACVIPVVDVQ